MAVFSAKILDGINLLDVNIRYCDWCERRTQPGRYANLSCFVWEVQPVIASSISSTKPAAWQQGVDEGKTGGLIISHFPTRVNSLLQASRPMRMWVPRLRSGIGARFPCRATRTVYRGPPTVRLWAHRWSYCCSAFPTRGASTTRNA